MADHLQEGERAMPRINPVRRWLIGLLYAAPGEAYLDLLRENHDLCMRISESRRALDG